MISRDQIIDTVRSGLEPFPFVLALWEAGSAAFRRVDRYSDIDLMIVTAGDRSEDTFAALEVALVRLGPLRDVYELPRPAWHGHHQKFYRLREASEFHMLDVLVMSQDADDLFLSPELHGEAQVLFDKAGVVAPPPFDPLAHKQRLRERLDQLGGMMRLLGNLPRKELLRGRPLDAIYLYHGLLLRPLVELLRMRHDPQRYNFGARYLYDDLPVEATARLESLMFVASAEGLQEKQQEVLDWFWDLHEKLDSDDDETRATHD